MIEVDSAIDTPTRESRSSAPRYFCNEYFSWKRLYRYFLIVVLLNGTFYNCRWHDVPKQVAITIAFTMRVRVVVGVYSQREVWLLCLELRTLWMRASKTIYLVELRASMCERLCRIESSYGRTACTWNEVPAGITNNSNVLSEFRDFSLWRNNSIIFIYADIFCVLLTLCLVRCCEILSNFFNFLLEIIITLPRVVLRDQFSDYYKIQRHLISIFNTYIYRISFSISIDVIAAQCASWYY